MRDRIIFVLVGALIGIVLSNGFFHDSANVQPVHAGVVLPAETGVVAMGSLEGMVLDENGAVWRLQTDGWVEVTNHPKAPPVAVENIKWWSGWTIVTTENVAWVFRDADETWVNIGPWPGGSIPTSENTWGGMKGKFKGE